MKKFGIRFSIVCALLFLVGVTALAAGGVIRNLKENDKANVTVTLLSEDGKEPVFQVTRKNAQNGKKYLLVIRNGPESEDLPEANLFYMGVETAKDGTVTFSNAYPKDMSNGPYRVYMSDYGENKLKQVATFEVEGNPGGETGGVTGGVTGGEVRYLGDVDGDKNITITDVQMLLNIFIHNTSLTGDDLLVANVDEDADKRISITDVQTLLNMLVHNTPKRAIS